MSEAAKQLISYYKNIIITLKRFTKITVQAYIMCHTIMITTKILISSSFFQIVMTTQ